jgi:hypothetical protein
MHRRHGEKSSRGAIVIHRKTRSMTMKAVERKLSRLPHLPSWFIDIHPYQAVE